MLSKILPVTLGISIGAFVLLATPFPLIWTILFFAGLTVFIASIMIQNRKKFFLTLMIVDMDLLINKHFFRDPDNILSIGGLQISVATIALGVLYLLWWGEMIKKTAKRIEFFPRITVSALGYILACLLSVYNSSNISASFFEIFFLIQMFMIYFYVVNYIKNKEDIIYILNILLFCLFIQSTTVFIQYFTQADFKFTGTILDSMTFEYLYEGKTTSAYRPTGTGGHPNWAGVHISMLLLMNLSLLLYIKNRFKNILVWVVLFMGKVALILTFSRGSWGGFAVGLVMFLFMALRHHWISGKKIVAVTVLIAVILCVFSVPMAARLSQDDQGSARSRIPLMKLAFNMIKEHPFIGVGINNFGIALPQYLSSELRGEWLSIVHNEYLLVFAETGIIGVFFFLLVIAIAIHTCLQCVKYNDPFLSPLLMGIVSGLIALLLFMISDKSPSRLTVQLFWIMASIAMASERLIKTNRRQLLNLSILMKVESPTYDKGSIVHGSR